MSNEPTKMTKELHLKLVAAYWDGELEFFHAEGGWRAANRAPHSESDLARYRIRPKPTLRPWKPEEVPPLALYWEEAFGKTVDGTKLWAVIIELRSTGFCHSGDYSHPISLINALGSGFYSTDGGKSWARCGVEESQ